MRTSSQRGLGPQDPRLSSLVERERSAAKDRGIWGQYVAFCSISNSLLTHNPFATLSRPFRIKCERYIFLKECVFVRHYLLIMFPHVYVSWLWLYNASTHLYWPTCPVKTQAAVNTTSQEWWLIWTDVKKERIDRIHADDTLWWWWWWWWWWWSRYLRSKKIIEKWKKKQKNYDSLFSY